MSTQKRVELKLTTEQTVKSVQVIKIDEEAVRGLDEKGLEDFATRLYKARPNAWAEVDPPEQEEQDQRAVLKIVDFSSRVIEPKPPKTQRERGDGPEDDG